MDSKAKAEFAFYDDDNEYLPRTYSTKNCVVYPGSHDADCVKSWCKGLSPEALSRFNKECPHISGQSRAFDLIELAMKSKANLAVIPMQDILELTNDEGRMNTPSVPDGNWTWRLGKRYKTASLIAKVKNLNERTKRATK